jgi:hypothetical protein
MFKNYIKYEFTGKTKKVSDTTLRQIRRLSDGKVGGWIEKEENLYQQGDSWIDDDAIVFGHARVFGKAQVTEFAEIRDYAQISAKCKISGYALVGGRTRVYGYAELSGNCKVYDHAMVSGHVILNGDVKVCNYAILNGRRRIYNTGVIVSQDTSSKILDVPTLRIDRHYILKMFKIPHYASDRRIRDIIRPYLCKYCIDDLRSAECQILLKILNETVHLTPFVETPRRRFPIYFNEAEQNALVRIFSYSCP